MQTIFDFYFSLYFNLSTVHYWSGVVIFNIYFIYCNSFLLLDYFLCLGLFYNISALYPSTFLCIYYRIISANHPLWNSIQMWGNLPLCFFIYLSLIKVFLFFLIRKSEMLFNSLLVFFDWIKDFKFVLSFKCLIH